jgi:heavy metal translocating P-type ATPase
VEDRNRLLLFLAGGALPLGFLAESLHFTYIADIVWASATALALAPLGISLIQSLRQRTLGVDVIALLAMAGALILRQFLAGAVIALMVLGGRALEEFARSRAKRELAFILSRAPRWAHRYEGAVLKTIPVEEVRRGDLLLIKPGEVVPVDGLLVEGSAVLDEAALTGEATPVQRKPAEQVRSGAINASGSPFPLRAGASAAESTYAGLIRLVRQAQQSKAPLVRLADRYAALFLPLTLGVTGVAWFLSRDPIRALAVLVVATPCPLILAAPVAIVAGISRAARRGIIVKDGAALETLARASTLVLDKTGTVTAGNPFLSDIACLGTHDPDQLLRWAASLDQVSPHVLAGPILRAARERQLPLSFPEEVVEELGSGIRGKVDGVEVALGKSSWIVHGEAAPPEVRRIQRRLLFEGTSGVFVAVANQLAGVLILEDPVRRDAPLTLRSLRRAGFHRIALLTGDHADVANAVGGILGVDEVLSERSPAEKVDAVKAERARAITVMVGDGINDAPALAGADIGVAMGARGATASSEAADIVLAMDRLDGLSEAVRIARRSRRIARQSICVGMGLSLVAIGFAAAGSLPPVAGAIFQELIDVLVILNALRALRSGGPERLPETTLNLGERYQAEHERLLPGVKRIRLIADQLDRFPPSTARNELLTLHRFLATEILPHEEAEESTMYPAVAKLIGGNDPTAPMNRAHLEIAHLVRVLGRHLDDVPPDGPTPEDIRDLRCILYGLDAILRLHFAQEDEAYLALIETR